MSRQELELKITVYTSSKTSNLGEEVRSLYNDGENGAGINLVSDHFSIDVVKIERADGLPLAIEEDFEGWYNETFKDELVSSKDQVKKAYIAGRRVK